MCMCVSEYLCVLLLVEGCGNPGDYIYWSEGRVKPNVGFRYFLSTNCWNLLKETVLSRTHLNERAVPHQIASTGWQAWANGSSKHLLVEGLRLHEACANMTWGVVKCCVWELEKCVCGRFAFLLWEREVWGGTEGWTSHADRVIVENEEGHWGRLFAELTPRNRWPVLAS